MSSCEMSRKSAVSGDASLSQADDELCTSASTRAVRLPFSPSQIAKCTASVDLPTPPFGFANAKSIPLSPQTLRNSKLAFRQDGKFAYRPVSRLACMQTCLLTNFLACKISCQQLHNLACVRACPRAFLQAGKLLPYREVRHEITGERDRFLPGYETCLNRVMRQKSTGARDSRNRETRHVRTGKRRSFYRDTGQQSKDNPLSLFQIRRYNY